MKKTLAAVALIASTASAAMAQTLTIHTGNGVKTYNLEQIDSITFSDQPNSEELVEMEVMNVSAYSFDLKVTKSSSCLKYMVAAYSKAVFNENNFVEAARQTLDVNAFYRPFAQTLSYDSSMFSEAQLGLNAVMSEDGKVAPQFVAAVYAIDDLGATRVFTKEFELPLTPAVESSEKATVAIDEKTLRYNHVDFSVRCGWNTAKVIMGATLPNYLDNKLTAAKWSAMSFEEQQAKLLSVFQGIPEAYKSGMKGSFDCDANSTCIVYAIPIDYDGKVGQVGIETVNTGAVPVDGKGAFTAVSAVEQTKSDAITFNVAVDNNAVAYRLMWFTVTDEKNSDYIKRLPELFYDKKYADYGMWREFSADDATVTLDVYRPGDMFYLYGVTVDRFGNISSPVNLGETYLGSKTISTMEGDGSED